MSAGTSVLGIFAIFSSAFLLSSGKRRINLRIVGAAFALQAVMAVFVLRTPVGITVIKGMSDAVSALLDYGNEGTKFLFGADNPLANTFAVGALPVIVFFASLVSIPHRESSCINYLLISSTVAEALNAIVGGAMAGASFINHGWLYGHTGTV